MKDVLESIKHSFIDLMALMVAIVAVVISVNQANSQKIMTLAGWQPVLVIELLKSDADSTNLNGFLLKNVGFGPAEITEFKYYKDSNAFIEGKFNHEWLDQKGNFKSLPSLNGFGWKEINYLNSGYVISSEAGDNKLYLLATDNEIYNAPIAKDIENIIFEVKYKSISSEDNNTYYLRFCESFLKNNIRDSTESNKFEKFTRF